MRKLEFGDNCYAFGGSNIDMPCGSAYGHTHFSHVGNNSPRGDHTTDHLILCEGCDKWHVLRMIDHKGNIFVGWLC